MKAFISHAYRDRQLARELASQLSQTSVDASIGEDEIAPGENWAQRMGQELDSSDVMIVMLTPNSADSDVVQQNLEYALSSRRFLGRVLPVIVGSETRVPWIVNKLESVRISSENQPPESMFGRVVEQVRALASAVHYVLGGDFPPTVADVPVKQLIAEAWLGWVAVSNVIVRQVHSHQAANTIVRGVHSSAPADTAMRGLKIGAVVDVQWDHDWSPERLQGWACRQFGFVLGLDYSDREDQLMSPTWPHAILSPQAEDVQRIQQLWGKPQEKPEFAVDAIRGV
jgi:hypothetical protein